MTAKSYNNILVDVILPKYDGVYGNIIGGAVFMGMSYWSAYLRPSGQQLSN
ncbi:MAG: hypothetical protein V3V57_08990 [Spirochaetia bacterium]